MFGGSMNRTVNNRVVRKLRIKDRRIFGTVSEQFPAKKHFWSDSYVEPV
jgi:hypothetical protein